MSSLNINILFNFEFVCYISGEEFAIFENATAEAPDSDIQFTNCLRFIDFILIFLIRVGNQMNILPNPTVKTAYPFSIF